MISRLAGIALGRRRVAVGPRLAPRAGRRSAGASAWCRRRGSPRGAPRSSPRRRRRGAARRAGPSRGTASMSRSSSQGSWALSSRSWMISSRRSSTARTSSCPARPPPRRGCAAPPRAPRAGRSSAFEGMHAQKEHSPPTLRSSTIATSRPPWASRPAATSPPGPAPEHHHVVAAHGAARATPRPRGGRPSAPARRYLGLRSASRPAHRAGPTLWTCASPSQTTRWSSWPAFPVPASRP